MRRPGFKRLPAERLQQKRLTSLAKAPKRVTKRELENSLAGRILASRRAKRLTLTLTITSLLTLVVLVLVATFSPLLAIKEIQVSGTNRIDPNLVQQALKDHIGTPLPLLSEEEVAKSLSGFELIESFSALAAPPNLLQVRIVERLPICIVSVSGKRYLYDPAGVQLEIAKESDLLPEIVINENPRGSERFRNAIAVLLALPVKLLDEVELIEASSKDNVRLTLRNAGSQRIIWGDSSQSILKSKVLEALMKNHRKSASVTFDVSSPNAPVVRFDDF